ncbi:MAG TPA: hypothetical protein H9787_09380 [Candidatus Oscillibacter excrementigallinarum]|uniref:Uncharacterized protein n=1 Tax=Candidatus Oscillibacter excrementigallinarum TaxID=2838716 RepID=A0A9D2RSN1_9FIRM|nr:hypothetical protein [Candidatus Oscillibacter excrementigallinarum]
MQATENEKERDGQSWRPSPTGQRPPEPKKEAPAKQVLLFWEGTVKIDILD